MVRGMQKSRTLRRVHKTTPGGKQVIHYKPRKPRAPVCARCDTVLKGVPRARPGELKKIPRSARRPNRPFGGVLCSRCARAELKK